MTFTNFVLGIRQNTMEVVRQRVFGLQKINFQQFKKLKM